MHAPQALLSSKIRPEDPQCQCLAPLAIADAGATHLAAVYPPLFAATAASSVSSSPDCQRRPPLPRSLKHQPVRTASQPPVQCCGRWAERLRMRDRDWQRLGPGCLFVACYPGHGRLTAGSFGIRLPTRACPCNPMRTASSRPCSACRRGKPHVRSATSQQLRQSKRCLKEAVWGRSTLPTGAWRNGGRSATHDTLLRSHSLHARQRQATCWVPPISKTMFAY